MKTQSQQSQKFWTANLSFWLGFSTACLGLLVMLGWYLRSPILIQINPQFAPMQFNTALAFLTSGMALACLTRQFNRVATACGLFVALFGIATLSQYLFNTNWGIDTLFVDPFVTQKTSHPGRASPPTAFCFFLVGVSLILLATHLWKLKRELMAQLTLVTVAAIACVAIIGYIGEIDTAFGWSYFTRMAVHTASGFCLLSVGLLNYAFCREHQRTSRIPTTLPYVVGMGFAVLAVLLWQAFSEWEKISIEKTISRETEAVGSHLSTEFTHYAQSLTRMANRQAQGTPKEVWAVDARLYLNHEPAYRGIAWVDPFYKVRWLISSSKDRSIRGASLKDGGRREAAFNLARLTGKTQITRSVVLKSGHKGFLIIAPIAKNAGKGFIVGAFGFDAIIEHLLRKQINDGFSIAMFDGTDSIYSGSGSGSGSGSWLNDARIKWRTTEVAIPTSWKLVISPSKSFIQAGSGYMSTVILVIGLLFAFVIAFALNLTQRIQLKNIALGKNIFQQTFLSTIGKTLSETMGYQERLEKMVEYLVPEIADLGVVAIIESNELRFKALAIRDKSKRDQLEGIGRHVKTTYNDLKTPRLVLSTGQPVLVENVELELLSKPDLDPLQRQRIEMFGVTSFLIVPLISRGHAMGTLTLSMTDSGRKFTQDDILFVQDIGNQCAVATENAKLYLEAQEATNARELILSIVSHDLKNPVAAIEISSQLLSRTSPLTSVKLAEIVKRIRSSTKIMQRMIFDLLDFRKIQSGTLSCEKVSVSIDSIVETTIEPMVERAREKALALIVEIEKCVPNIMGDHDRIVQVMWNLVGNAVKFSPTQGKIWINAKRDGDFVQFAVTDSGPGLEPEDIPKVFDQFWQSANTASLGTGLGLSIAKGIVAAHGGKIWVESKKGHGCTFKFTLPISHQQVVQRHTHAEDVEVPEKFDQPLRGIHVLAVDDSIDNLHLLKLLLEKAGAKVTAVGTLSDALIKITQCHPDVVITDIEMPDGDGFDLIQKVHQLANAEDAQIPVVAMTAHSGEKDLKKISTAGFDAQLFKPVSFDQLVSSVSSLVEARNLH